ncbi:hypothetical protein ABFS83_07G003200 [Erythranthe nasuta]
MDPVQLNANDTIIDIDCCNKTSEEVGISSPAISDDIGNGSVSILIDPRNNVDDNISPKFSAKKPPRPPKKAGALPLDAADVKLIKEIAELIAIKRSRIERIKKMKLAAAKASNTNLNSSSGTNLVALVFTIVFCIVMISQGCHSWRI